MDIGNHCSTAAAATMDGFEVIVPEHPLIRHWVSVLRDQDTPSHAFRSAMGELGRLLVYEATRDWLPTEAREIQSPMGPAVVESVNHLEPVMIVPIFRAGLALAELVTSVLPSTRTFHLGALVLDNSWYKLLIYSAIVCIARDERALQPSVYLNKLPDRFLEGCHILLMDPMLATGGTVAAAVDLLKDHGAEIGQIRIISAVAAPLALKKLHNKFPGICVYAGAMDQTVNEKWFIVPGLGDAGDRSYGT